MQQNNGTPPHDHHNLTISQAQQLVHNWISATGAGYFSRLTNTLILAEETGEIARIIARTDGQQRPKPSDDTTTEHLADELADILWVTIAIANQSKIDLSQAFVNNLAKKNIRDKERFALGKPKTDNKQQQP